MTDRIETVFLDLLPVSLRHLTNGCWFLFPICSQWSKTVVVYSGKLVRTSRDLVPFHTASQLMKFCDPQR
jgi:hypothetical protein